MGLFDIIEDITDKVVETTVSAPTLPFKILDGASEGVKKGKDNLEEALKEFEKKWLS